MWQAIIITISLVGALVYFVSCKSSNGAKQSSTDNVSSINNSKDSIKIDGKPMTKQEIAKKLNDLAKSTPPEPDKLDMGAMCYKMAGPPNRADYICPKCGHKTIYNDFYAKIVERDLSQARSFAQGLEKFNILLDESEFCIKCQKNKTDKPEMKLIINYKDNKEPRVVSPVSVEDIQIVSEFLNGRKIHSGAYGRESALKDYSVRLAEILGVEIK